MKEIVHKLRKRWVWGIGVFLLLTVGLFGFMNFKGHQLIKAADSDVGIGNYKLYVRSVGDSFSDNGKYVLSGAKTDTLMLDNLEDVAQIKWTLSSNGGQDGKNDVLEIINVGGQIGEILDIRALSIGRGTVNAQVWIKGQGNPFTIHLQVVVPVAMEETVHTNNGETERGKQAFMKKMFPEDEHCSIIMDEGATWRIGTDADLPAEINMLNLFVGNAQELEWDTNDKNVLQPNPTAEDGSGNKVPVIYANGGGHAKLKGSPKAGVEGESVEIDVYVRPKMQIGDEVFYGKNEAISVKSGTYISFPGITFDADENATPASLEDRITYVIAYRASDTNYKLLFDSLGNKGTDSVAQELLKDGAVKLTPYPPDGDQEAGYLFEAKAGNYIIAFYPKGAYKNYELSLTDERYNYASSFYARVDSNFNNKTINLNVNGRYNLSDGLNISKSLLLDRNQFDIEIGAEDITTASGSAISREHISFGSDHTIIQANKVGTATVTITRKTSSTADIPGASRGGKIVITFIIGDSFALNTPTLTLALGETSSLMGMLNGLTAGFPLGSNFEWEPDNDNVKIDSSGSEATITGNKLGKTIVTLYWTDTQGITQVATCVVTVVNTTIPIVLSDKEVELNSGESKEIAVVNFEENNTTLLWVSSNEAVAKVESISDRRALVTAGTETGDAYITVINTRNNTIAVCKVTVRRSVESIQITAEGGEITDYSVPITQGFLQLGVLYQPENATNAEFVWHSGDESTATIDKNTGLMQLLKPGSVRIYVETVDMSKNMSCYITITDVPLQGISLKETKLSMVVGQKYKVIPTLSPANPTNAKLSWSSSDPSVVRVDGNGEITAVKAGGPVSIVVSGGDNKMASLSVSVLNKLNTIKFEETDITIEEGEKKELRVTYTPAADVNTKLSFVSTDTSIATVDAKGVVTGVKEGMAMIIATAEELGTTGAITCMIHVTAPKVPVEEFSIDPEEMSLFVGEEQQITPIYIPDDTSRQEVTYTAGNEAVATVSEEGLVTAVAPGFTIITCQDVASGKTAICQVSVETGIKFTLSPASREIAIGKSFNLKKVTVPSNAKKTATWKSSNKAIASVNSSGKVTGKKLGSCTITCTLTYYGQSATCRVKVAKLKSSVKLDKTSIRMNIGSTYRLKKTVTSNDSKLPSVKFTSKNSSIASVGANSGKIKAKRVGSTYIVAKTTDATHATARCRVIVIRRASGVSLNKAYAVCYIGRTLKLKAKVSPSNATIKKVKWSSSDKKVAVVNGSGKITGYAEGETYITATTTDGGNKKARCLVKVMEPIETSSIMVAQTNLTMKRGDTAKLSYTILPDDHTDTIKMASDNTRVATVTNSGKVKAVGTGTATITIMAESGVTATVTVNVVALNKTSIRMRQYDTETLVVHGTSDPITWYSANTSIATVVNGKVVGRSVGTTYVYAYVNGCRMSCRIEVVSIN